MWCHCLGPGILGSLLVYYKTNDSCPLCAFHFFYYLCLDFPVVPFVILLTKLTSCIWSAHSLSLSGIASAENESPGRVEVEALPDHSLCNRYWVPQGIRQIQLHFTGCPKAGELDTGQRNRTFTMKTGWTKHIFIFTVETRNTYHCCIYLERL